jgi:fructose-bisphosphate aldolase class II
MEEVMAIHYKDLGLVNTKVVFQMAMEGGYAIPAYNFNNMEQLQAVIAGCVETDSPVILQISRGARKYANQTMLRYMAMGAVQMMKEMGGDIPIAVHLDHGDGYDVCVDCIENGFSSVMIDGSHLPYEENVAVTRKVVDYARQFDVSVEGELGVLAGIEEDVEAEQSTYTRPEEVEDFTKRTSVDSLAISIGTSHGAYKFKVKPGEEPPPLRFDILDEVAERLPGFPIVLHGASSVVPEYIEMINRYGGHMEGAVGVSEDQLRRAARGPVCKINIDSDCRLAVTAAVRKVFAEQPDVFDPRKYLGPARDELTRLVKHKNEAVLGSAGHGREIMSAIGDRVSS